ncbi:uncharacterized protein Z518_08545 [Rhinocladiella mackenziei CBS 650.93]|uniref:Uncharacterized protein n=1 Tax=Rhinocladiella mackenziei CBS 650.93 TaxID=1442369 RepID=A0A0D2I9Q1_9EURO|nr:uncharacterized protein Z518_08545 [Rhinocladiella mackenziei CBS 650.93]KIX02604.1 hypothetical protein Z518_08545 [Rhinocladiella mackenziei CBS 650.93]
MAILAMGRPLWTTDVSERRVWNTDQAPFRFFVAGLLYADVISGFSLMTAMFARLSRKFDFYRGRFGRSGV